MPLLTETPEGKGNRPNVSKFVPSKLMRIILEVIGADLLTAFKNRVLKSLSTN